MRMVFGFDGSSMRFDDRSAYCQTEASSADIRHTAAKKFIENSPFMSCRKTWSPVSDFDHHGVGTSVSGNLYCTVRRCVFQRVFDEVDKDLFHQQWVDFYHR